MQSKSPRSPHKSSGKANDIRWLITAVSLTCTLFFWYLFSKQDLTSAAVSPDAQVAPPPTTGQTSDNSAFTLNLPPIPTLVPPLSDLSNSVSSAQPAAAAPAAAQSQPNIAAPAPAQGPVKILLGGAAPQTKTSRPAARTRSS